MQSSQPRTHKAVRRRSSISELLVTLMTVPVSVGADGGGLAPEHVFLRL